MATQLAQKEEVVFVVLLRFADRGKAPSLMAAHNEWVSRGFEEGVFMLVGSLRPGPGGCIVAHGASRAEIDARVSADPFVAEGVVEMEILEVAPSKVEPRLAFLMD